MTATLAAPLTRRFAAGPTGLADHKIPAAEGTALWDKDILRLGRWFTDSGIWDVSRAVLQDLADNCRRYLSRGYSIPLQWDHSPSARDKAGEVVDAWTDGEVLWVRLTSTDPQTVRQLNNGTNDEVSVEVTEPWTDGEGNEYSCLLTHLGICNHGIVSHQGPFRRLQLAKGKHMAKQTVRRLQKEGEGDEPEGGADATTGSVADFKELINEVFGVTLPDDVDTFKELKIALKAMKGGEEPEPDGEEPAIDAGMESMKPTQMSLSQARRCVSGLRHRLAKVDGTLQSLKKAQEDQSKAAWTAELDGLVEAGKITPAQRSAIDAIGPTTRYQLSALSPYRDLPATLKTQRHTRKLAQSGHAPLDDDRGTPERVAGAGADFWGFK